LRGATRVKQVRDLLHSVEGNIEAAHYKHTELVRDEVDDSLDLADRLCGASCCSE
jgi:hypothetical protein